MYVCMCYIINFSQQSQCKGQPELAWASQDNVIGDATFPVCQNDNLKNSIK